MQKQKEMTTLQWLAPSMVRDGLLKNGDWVLSAAAEAEKIFTDTELKLPAQFLVALNKFALDYIKQAPVLVVAASGSKDLLRRDDRLDVGRRFISACGTGTKLAALMQSYELAPQLRALSGSALRRDQGDLLKVLSSMLPASPLAQAIPQEVEQQRIWLRSLYWWRAHMGRHFQNRNLFLDWAAINLRDDQARSFATDVADFAGRNREVFDLEWNFQQALAASQRWHGELALRRPIAEASRADWRTIIDYAPLPALFETDGIEFHALQTREALYQEGARMHHCVRLYSDKVACGNSRIYSLRSGAQQIATLELIRTSRASASKHTYRMTQLKGPRNSNPADAVWKATATFLSTVNMSTVNVSPVDEPPAAGVPGTPVGDGRGSRSLERLRSRLGDDVYTSWFRRMMQFETLDGTVLRVSFPTRFLKRWIEMHYAGDLLECCREEFAGVERIEVTVRQQPRPRPETAPSGTVRRQLA